MLLDLRRNRAESFYAVVLSREYTCIVRSMLGTFAGHTYVHCGGTLTRETARVPQSVTGGCASMLIFWTSTELARFTISHHIHIAPFQCRTPISHVVIILVHGFSGCPHQPRRCLFVRHAASVETPNYTDCTPMACMPHVHVGATANRRGFVCHPKRSRAP